MRTTFKSYIGGSANFVISSTQDIYVIISSYAMMTKMRTSYTVCTQNRLICLGGRRNRVDWPPSRSTPPVIPRRKSHPPPNRRSAPNPSSSDLNRMAGSRLQLCNRVAPLRAPDIIIIIIIAIISIILRDFTQKTCLERTATWTRRMHKPWEAGKSTCSTLPQGVGDLVTSTSSERCIQKVFIDFGQVFCLKLNIFTTRV